MMVDTVIKQEVIEPREVILTWKDPKPKEILKYETFMNPLREYKCTLNQFQSKLRWKVENDLQVY